MSVYSCRSTDPADQRVKSEVQLMQDGWRTLRRGDIVTREPVMVEVKTDWVRKGCGSLEQVGWEDTNCRGCVHA